MESLLSGEMQKTVQKHMIDCRLSAKLARVELDAGAAFGQAPGLCPGDGNGLGVDPEHTSDAPEPKEIHNQMTLFSFLTRH